MTEKAAFHNITQDSYPGAFIEPEWQWPDMIANAPYYAIRLLCGAVINPAVNGNTDYASILLDGEEYVLHRNNFEKVIELAESALHDLMIPSGYNPEVVHRHLRLNSNLLIDSIKWLSIRARQQHDIPAEKARLFMVSGDFGACSAFRSEYPFAHLKASSRLQDHIFADRSQFLSMGSLSYYDAVMIHRCPSTPMLKIIRAFKRAGKYVVYETDDDFFNIPDFNINSSAIKDEDRARIREVMELADKIIVTNSYLAESLGYQDKTVVCPNLIQMGRYKQIEVTRGLNQKLLGIRCDFVNGSPVFYDSEDAIVQCPVDMSPGGEYDPVRILWFGSNTHDGDLAKIVPAIKSIGKIYGMAVRFIFFGYIPTEFAFTRYDRGNVARGLEVKDEYKYFIDYIRGVPYAEYHNALNSIPADFGVCPLDENEFNLSKSELKPLELGARRIPSIVSDYGPYKFIEHRKNGLKVPNTTSEWIGAISELIENAQLRIQLGNAMLSTVYQHHSWNNPSNGTAAWDSALLRIGQEARDRRLARSKAFEEQRLIKVTD